MTTWKRVQGDLKDTLTVTLDGVVDLASAVTVVAHVWRNGVAPITLTAAVTNPTTRLVTIQLGSTGGWLATAAPTTWWLEVQVTFTDGTVLTWPAGTPDMIIVRAQGA